MAEDSVAEPITIKKYANRRLYNTATSRYVTLDDLSRMVKDGSDFVVVDAKTGADITRSVLTQIIFEEENRGHNLLPISFLRQLIQFYGDSLQSVVPSYLDYSMRAFATNQERMRAHMGDAMGPMFPFTQWEEVGKQNLAMFERAMEMFTPFGGDGDGADGDGRPDGGAATNADDADSIEALKSQLERLQERVEKLSREQ